MASEHNITCRGLLQTYYSKLVDTIDPSTVAASLYSAGFISAISKSDACELGLTKRVKSEQLVDAIAVYINSFGDDQLDEQSRKFLELLKILKRHIPVNIVAQSMEKEWMSAAGSSTAVGTTTSMKTVTLSSDLDQVMGSRPKLPQILAFPFAMGKANITQKISDSWETFGILLLEDDDGSVVSSLRTPNQTPQDITFAIVKYWIKGNGKTPTTWRTLIDTIQEAGCTSLARDMKQGLGNL